MTENDFRIQYSSLIETYQYIEFRLKAICADLLVGKDKRWMEILKDYDSDPLGKMLQEIVSIQNRTGCFYLTQSDIDNLNELREERNYWCHHCFGSGDIVFTRNGLLKNNGYATMLLDAIRKAEEWDEKLASIARQIASDKSVLSYL